MKTLLGMAVSPGHPYVDWSLAALDIATADTKWNPRLETLLALGGRFVLCDSGGMERGSETERKIPLRQKR